MHHPNRQRQCPVSHHDHSLVKVRKCGELGVVQQEVQRDAAQVVLDPSHLDAEVLPQLVGTRDRAVKLEMHRLMQRSPYTCQLLLKLVNPVHDTGEEVLQLMCILGPFFVLESRKRSVGLYFQLPQCDLCQVVIPAPFSRFCRSGGLMRLTPRPAVLYRRRRWK